MIIQEIHIRNVTQQAIQSLQILTAVDTTTMTVTISIELVICLVSIGSAKSDLLIKYVPEVLNGGRPRNCWDKFVQRDTAVRIPSVHGRWHASTRFWVTATERSCSTANTKDSTWWSIL